MAKVTFRKMTSSYSVTLEARRPHIEVIIHTLWEDGTATDQKMALHEAWEFQARNITDVKAITIHRAA